MIAMYYYWVQQQYASEYQLQGSTGGKDMSSLLVRFPEEGGKSLDAKQDWFWPVPARHFLCSYDTENSSSREICKRAVSQISHHFEGVVILFILLSTSSICYALILPTIVSYQLCGSG